MKTSTTTVKRTTPKLDQLPDDEPDFIEKIFKLILKEHPELAGQEAKTKESLRKEFGGAQYYVNKRNASDFTERVLSLWDGRNITTVARELGVTRGTVYRHVKANCK